MIKETDKILKQDEEIIKAIKKNPKSDYVQLYKIYLKRKSIKK